MEPISFKEQNKVLYKPEGWQDKECGALPIWNDGKQCISCWKATWRERLSLLIFGKLWLYVVSGPTQPPVAIEVKRTVFTQSKSG